MKKPDDKSAEWPKGVEAISYANIGRLGVGRDNTLYWDGRKVETQRKFKLTEPQAIGAFLVGFAAFVGGLGTGLNEGLEFFCKLQGH